MFSWLVSLLYLAPADLDLEGGEDAPTADLQAQHATAREERAAALKRLRTSTQSLKLSEVQPQKA